MNLPDCEKEWLNLYVLLQNFPDRFGIKFENVAGLFLSDFSNNHDVGAKNRVLLVGKATGGDWFKNEYSCTVEDRKKCTREFLENYIETGEYSSAFWNFARRLSELASDNDDAPSPLLKNLIWTNLTKIGVQNGNPNGKYFKLQLEIARTTMLAEILFYKPKVVVVAHSDYAIDLVHSIFGLENSLDWNKEDDKKIWWKRQKNGMPNIMLIDHPQYKRKEIIDYWLSVSERLLQLE